MKIALASLAPLAAICLGISGPASAAPYGGAAFVPAHAVAQSAVGFRIYAPDLIPTADGSRLHGSVCRTGRSPAASPSGVSLQVSDSKGHVIGKAVGGLSGNLSGRTGLGCAYYDLETGWSIAATDTVRVCLVGRPEDAACAATD